MSHKNRNSYLLHLFSRDDNLLDDVVPNPTVIPDALIEINKIQYATDTLRNSTMFLENLEILGQTIPFIQTSVNELIAGDNRTLADLFDFTGET